MKQLVSAAIAVLFATVTFTAAAQGSTPSGAPAADVPKVQKTASKKQKKAKKAKKTRKSADRPMADAPAPR